MVNGLGSSILPQIQRIFHGGTLVGTTDGELLERFATSHDDASFEALLARYGPLVLSVCRNLLHDRGEVEDAFQATFFVLVRKAGSLRIEGSLGPWIYAVAYRVANRARANHSLRMTRERTNAELNPEVPSQDLDCVDMSPLLHDELARLPERLRAPIILCYFQGLTHEIAAQQLQWPVGTVRSRMARARVLLRSRLVRKGVVPSAGFLVAASRRASAAPLRRTLSEETTRAALQVAAGRLVVAGALSSRAATLMEGVLNAMWLTKLKTAAGAAIVTGVILTGAVALAVQPPSDKAGRAASNKAIEEKSDPIPPEETASVLTKTYYVGDLLNVPSDGPLPTTGPNHQAGRKANFTPLIELLTTTVAPGTWRRNGDVEEMVSTPLGLASTSQEKNHHKIGSMTPFFLSISLVIRHTAEVHDEVATRLRQLRSFVAQRYGLPSESHESRGVDRSAKGKAPEPPPVSSGARVQQPREDLLGQEPADLVRRRASEKHDEMLQRVDRLEQELDTLSQGGNRTNSARVQFLIKVTKQSIDELLRERDRLRFPQSEENRATSQEPIPARSK